jgi:hypothetical protein
MGEQQTVCVSEMAQHLYLIFVFHSSSLSGSVSLKLISFFNLSKGISLP